MRNSLKAFLFCIVLPAIGLAAVGLFLLSVGVDNLKKVGVEVLQSTAQQTAQHIRQQVQAEVDETFAEIGRLTVTNRAALAGIAAARPLVKDEVEPRMVHHVELRPESNPLDVPAV